MDIGSGLAAAGNALTIAKTLKSIDKDYDAATYKMKIIELIDALTDAKLALAEAKEKLAENARKIVELIDNTQRRERLLSGEGGYQYRSNANGERQGYPVCPRCLSDQSKITALVQNVRVDAAKCPSCRTEYQPITCYIPPSENNGLETTAWAQHIANREEQSRKTNEALERINRGAQLFRGSGTW